MQCQSNIRDQGSNLLREGQLLIQRLLEIHGRKSEIVLQHEVVKIEHFAETRGKTVSLEQVRDPHGAPGDLVFVGRADSATGGADGIRSPRHLTSLVELDMGGKDERTVR